jgi:hypothetical protein
MSFQSTRVGWSFLNQSLALPCKLSFVILIGTYLPTYLPQICPFDMDKNLTNQKNHSNHNGHVKIDLSKMMDWFF